LKFGLKNVIDTEYDFFHKTAAYYVLFQDSVIWDLAKLDSANWEDASISTYLVKIANNFLPFLNRLKFGGCSDMVVLWCGPLRCMVGPGVNTCAHAWSSWRWKSV